MINLNIKKLTIISFLLYSFTGALAVITGNIIGNLSIYFKVSLSNMSLHFAFLNLGILVAMIVNTYIKKNVFIKNKIIFSFFLVIISMIILFFNNKIIEIFSLFIFLMGFVGGLSLSIGTFLIANIYEGKQRGFYMLITDSFFSVSGIIFPMISGFLIFKKIDFFWIYLLVSLVYFIIFCLTLITDFNNLESKIKNNYKEKESLKLENILLFLLSLFYISAQSMFISWIPTYVKNFIKIDSLNENKIASIFWFFYMLGMWFFSYINKILDLQKILIFLTGMSSLFIFIFLQCNNFNLLSFIMIFIGFFSSAIYTIIITLSAMQTKIPSIKFVNLTLISGTTGSFITFNASNFLLSSNNTYLTLYTSNILYLIVFFMSILLTFFTKHNKYNK
ncbi:MFS transporter TsgA [Candidatus Annandia pinicola]|uniref:MFS transporter TsgA n=1 Tax=Candidatus Annandia pinicola TaxID=1345117 RepID=UPI001D029AD7|nr:MFS transporter TsgA [Candidatus Annandia pinicola]UDG80263.1 Protein TsgA [Candidatus Annandia pinicola]